MTVNTRKFWLKVHLVVALITGLPLAAAGVTGAILGFAPELHPLLQPELYRVEPTGERLAAPEVARRIRADFPNTTLHHVTAHPDPDRAWIAYASGPLPDGARGGYRLLIDPYTGRISRQIGGEGFLHWVEVVHRNLGAGPVGRYLVGASSLLLALLCITGVYLWWPMWRNTFRRLLRGRVVLGWHNLVGLLSLPLLVAMGITGAQFTFGNFLRPVVHAVTFAPEMPEPPGSTVVPGAERIPLPDAIRTVQERFPDASVTAFADPGGDAGAYKVHLGRPGQVNQYGWERVWVDQYSAEILAYVDTYEHSLASIYDNAWWALHTAEVFGPLARGVWAVASFLTAVLFATGLILWLKRRRREARGRVRRARNGPKAARAREPARSAPEPAPIRSATSR